jgi:hypothetical protein
MHSPKYPERRTDFRCRLVEALAIACALVVFGASALESPAVGASASAGSAASAAP